MIYQLAEEKRRFFSTRCSTWGSIHKNLFRKPQIDGAAAAKTKINLSLIKRRRECSVAQQNFSNWLVTSKKNKNIHPPPHNFFSVSKYKPKGVKPPLSKLLMFTPRTLGALKQSQGKSQLSITTDLMKNQHKRPATLKRTVNKQRWVVTKRSTRPKTCRSHNVITWLQTSYDQHWHIATFSLTAFFQTV